jgi:hypothetical protein
MLVAGLVGTAMAQHADTRAGRGTPSVGIEAKVRKEWELYKNKDKAGFGALLTSDFRTVEDGAADFAGKESELDEMGTTDVDQYKLSKITVKLLGANSALVTYVAEYSGKAGGESMHVRAAFGEIWVRQGKDWKCSYSQSTALHEAGDHGSE